MSDELFERGLSVRREVLGEGYVERALDESTPFDEPWQTFITRTAWGSVWARDGLDRRTRSMLTVALLAALGHEHELAAHVRGARRNGVSAGEIGEVLLHTSVYAGVPAANRAFAVARRALGLDEEDA